MSSTTTYSGDNDGDVGLTTTGVRRAVASHCELQGDREGVGPQRQSLRSMLGALVRQDGPLSEYDLQAYFKPARQDAVDQGHYIGHKYSRFWNEVGRPQLLAVPGVEETDGGLHFVGADPSAFDVDTEHIRPLDELRADPRTKALTVLDDRFGSHSAERENIMKLYDAITGAQQVGESELERKHVFTVSSDDLDVLDDLPGIEREVRHPPEPKDIPIETYQDVLDAEQAVDQTAETVWRAKE